MVQKINQDDKRQSGGYSWIDLQEKVMDGIIPSSKRWTKQDELQVTPLRYHVQAPRGVADKQSKEKDMYPITSIPNDRMKLAKMDVQVRLLYVL